MEEGRSRKELKDQLQKTNPNFAWEVMELQVNVETADRPSIKDISQLLQMYMTAVEVLENQDDNRYRYFNAKIHQLMMRKKVIEQLHHDPNSPPPQAQALKNAAKHELDHRKQELNLQVYLQQEAFTMSSARDLLKREHKVTQQRTQQIQNGISRQDRFLQQRIQSRKLRSLSKGKSPQQQQGIPITKVTYQTTPQSPKK